MNEAVVNGGGTMDVPRLGYVIGTYPSLTTTFIDREIEVLRRRGVTVHVTSLRRPRSELSAQQRELQDGVRYVLPVPPAQLVSSHGRFLRSRPRSYLGVLLHLLRRPHPSARARWRTLLHIGMAVHVARLVQDGPPVDHLHAHFVDRAAVVALVVGRLLDLPFSATAHANDIYVDPVLLPEKLTEARFVATCTRYNAAHLASVADAARVICLHHGLDATGYEPSRSPPDATAPPSLLCVAQLRPKKGLAELIDACADLRDRGQRFTCTIVGEGPLRAELAHRIAAHGLGDRVTLAGARSHLEVISQLRRASLFVLPCVTAPNGDRDGIPNAILEAMAMEVAVVSTRHSGIPEAVEDGVSGRLVEPHDVVGLSTAIAELLDDPDRRRRLGRRGREAVLTSFDLEVNVGRLLHEFGARESIRA